MFIPVTHGRLEARLHLPESEPLAAGVFCHPHPLYGGSMNTRAVFRICRALMECGVAVLRFNFRGVGASTGGFDGGAGELDDARCAIGWMRERFFDQKLVVGGFSFGSAIGMQAGVEEPRTGLLIGAGVPVIGREYDFSPVLESNLPLFVVQGGHDEFGTPEQVREAFEGMGERLHLTGIPGADHLFTGRMAELRDAVKGRFRSEEVRLRLAAACGQPADREQPGTVPQGLN